MEKKFSVEPGRNVQLNGRDFCMVRYVDTGASPTDASACAYLLAAALNVLAGNTAELEKLAKFEVEAEPMDENPLGYFASGDDAQDRADEESIINRIADGDVWAWACVRVKATIGEQSAYSTYLGACSYADEADFTGPNGDYYADLKQEALVALIAGMQGMLRGLMPADYRGFLAT